MPRRILTGHDNPHATIDDRPFSGFPAAGPTIGPSKDRRAHSRIRFALAWQAYRRVVPHGGARIRPADMEQPGDSPFTTTVIRLPPEVAMAVHAATAGLRRRFPEHYHYPPETLHVTVLRLEPVPRAERASGPDRGGSDAGSLQELANRLTDAVGAVRPFELWLRGFNLAASSVFAEVVGPTRDMRRLRAVVGRAAAGTGGFRGSRPGLLQGLGGLGFSNVARFTSPVRPAMVAEIAALRRVELGRFMVREIELVRTDKVLSEKATLCVASLPLSGGPG